MERYLSYPGTSRNRAGSLGDLEEGVKRKREEESSSRSREDQQIFKKSNKTRRSPERTKVENMDEILKRLDMLADIKQELKEIKESSRQLQKDNEEIRESLKIYQQRTEEENKVLRGEIKTLQEKIETLENKEEKREKSEKKTNIIITQKLEEKVKKDQEQVKQHVRELCKWITGKEVDLREAYCITTNKAGLQVIRARMGTFEEKITIMKNKHKLATMKEKIYIEDDLTREEARVQKSLRDRAQEERKQGNKTKIGYRKIKINEKWIDWKDLDIKE